MNQTKYKDPVLETFLEKAKEVEQHAGRPEENQSAQKAESRERKDYTKQFLKNPLRYYTVTDFDRAIRQLK